MSFASDVDYEYCRLLHRRHGTTYYLATRRFPPALRRRVHAIYGFVREADEWVDHPRGETPEVIRARLAGWREQLRRAYAGACPDHPALRAFADVARETGLPLAEPLCFLDAMESDLTVTRYPTYADLEAYMRGSAAAVGVMMCYATGAPTDSDTLAAARRLGEAMQLTNFLRDVGEDHARGRIYLPQEDMARFGVSEADLAAGRATPEFRALMAFEIARARRLYQESDAGAARLPRAARPPVLVARVLYARILDAIERQHGDVFVRRARTSRAEKAWVAAVALVAPGLLARRLAGGDRSPMAVSS